MRVSIASLRNNGECTLSGYEAWEATRLVMGVCRGKQPTEGSEGNSLQVVESKSRKGWCCIYT